MKVSVVIPAYNSASFLETTITSVMRQTYQDVEIIVVDDGSTDRTAAVMARFSGVCRYIYQDHAGSSAARNRGIENSVGELVAFLDADDAWLPRKLEEQVGLLARHPDVGLVETGSFLCDEQLRSVRYLPPARLRGRVFEAMLVDSKVPSTSTVLVRRTCLDQAGGFDPKYRNVQDYDLWLRLARCCRFDYLEEGFAYQRVHAGHSLKDGRSMLDAYTSIVHRHLSDHPSLKPRMAAAFQRAELSALKLMCLDHRRKDALSLAVRHGFTRGWRNTVRAYFYLTLLILPKWLIPSIRKLYWQCTEG